MKIKKSDRGNSIEEIFLKNQGIKSINEINNWYKKHYAGGYHIDRLDEAVDLIIKFKDKPITIIGDYDVDGVTGTSEVLLSTFLCGFKNVKYRIPKRFSEGFGINTSIIDEINEGLIITVDNGVAQLEAIKKAKDKGLTVIVTDHHEAVRNENGRAILPPADIIIDPNAVENSADFNGYCGAGIAFKLSVELLKRFNKENYKVFFYPYAAMGTVADVMDLKSENYVITKIGLKYMTENPTAGIQALLNTAGLKKISAHDIGFKIGPMINAVSRLQDDGANIAVELLSGTDYYSCIQLAQTLNDFNERRKELKRKALKSANAIITQDCMYGDTPLVVYIPNTLEGVIGIIAGNLCEKYKVPAIVLTDAEEEGILKGSARSCGNCNIKEALDKVQPLLLKYGGHEGAAGMSLKKSDFDEFRSQIQSIVSSNFIPDEDAYIDESVYDLEIDAKDIPSTLEILSRYEPFGKGNPAPVFKVRGFETIPKGPSYKRYMGDGSIVKLETVNHISAISFAENVISKMSDIEKPKKLDMIGTLSYNYFNGNEEYQIEFSDFELVENVKSTDLSKRLAAMALKTCY